MPIDTTSYYPEVPSDNGTGESLNAAGRDLFGSSRKPEIRPEGNCGNGNEDGRQDKGKDNEHRSDLEKASDIFSTFLSWTLVPLMMPVYGMMLIFGLSILDNTPAATRTVFTLIVAAFNLLVPMILVLLLKKMGLVHDVGLNERKERMIPYIITILCMGGTGLFMLYKGSPMWVGMFFTGGAAAALVNLIINFKWKISAHSAGIAGIVALLIRIIKDGNPEPSSMSWLIVWILLAGLLGTARVWLGRHTVWQILAGYAVGFCSVFFLTML